MVKRSSACLAAAGADQRLEPLGLPPDQTLSDGRDLLDVAEVGISLCVASLVVGEVAQSERTERAPFRLGDVAEQHRCTLAQLAITDDRRAQRQDGCGERGMLREAVGLGERDGFQAAATVVGNDRP